VITSQKSTVKLKGLLIINEVILKWKVRTNS